MNVDDFTVYWSGLVQPLYSGEYTFYVTSDDGTSISLPSWSPFSTTVLPRFSLMSFHFNILLGASLTVDGVNFFDNLGPGQSPTEFSGNNPLP
jgi:hypothetical protein